MPSNIFASLVNHIPYLLVPPSQLEACRREFPGIVVRVYETIPLERHAARQIPRNRHERRTAKKLERSQSRV